MAETGGILAGFLPALTEQISESVVEVTGEVENALHKRLDSTGSKKQQARQLNAVAKGSGKYMSKVHRAFEKNFDKFELYVRRNIVSVPDALADEVAQIRAEKQKTDGDKDNVAAQEAEDMALLTREEREERTLDNQLEALRLNLRELTASNQQLEMEKKALDLRAQRFQGLVSQLAFLDDVPERTISPLKRTAEHISALQDAFLRMDSIQAALEEDSRQFKKSKVATRGSFRKLRKQFTARTAEMTYRTTEDLEDLHSKLPTS
ncbi:Mis12 protein [Phytophthora infestans]|uniref:Mis12 protein n=1 Tax=Phytophthora infestans TaxID=4787 RepID=A0A8S9TMP9_PHYIN|nr:Mis12 protein [Phytophthora infestans]